MVKIAHVEDIYRIQYIADKYLKDTLHYEREVVMLDYQQRKDFARIPLAMSNYVVVILVLQGEVEVLINGVQRHRIQAQGMLYHLPEYVFQVTYVSDDFDGKCMLMSSEFASRLGTFDSMDMTIKLARHPFVALGNEAISSLMHCYGMIENLLSRGKDNPYLPQILHHILKAYMLTFTYYFREDYALQAPATREEELAYRFLALVKEHFRQEHQLDFYANALCVSIKHLSRCVKHVTGQAAKACIDRYLIAYAQMLLSNKELSVNSVGYELGFDDPSNFGKFFRKHTGMSPHAYRL